jgi:surface protein
MERMFFNCNSLISLKFNFTTPKVANLDYMFYNCSSLISLDLNNFITSSISMKDIFYNISDNLIFCIDEDNNPDIISYLNLNYPNYYNNCSDICFNKTIKIKINENNTCSFDCINDEVYKFEYKNMCYESCPNGTHNSTSNNFICEEDTIENNICNNSCNVINFLKNICIISNDNIICKDDIIIKIRKAILNGLFDSLIEEDIINKNKDLYTENDNIIYQLTSTYNQNKNEYI